MWSVWLVFCDCGFIVFSQWIRIRGLWKLPDWSDWLWGKLGLVLMSGAMLSKSLIQFSVDGQGCVPFLLFGLRPNYGRGNEGDGDLLQKDLCTVQFSSGTQSGLTLCDPMNRSTLGLPVHHQLPEFTQTHVHWVSDAIQPSHPLSSPSPPAPSPSQHQSFPMSQLFAWGGQSIGVSALASFLPKNTQDWSPLEWTGWISLKSKGLSRVFSNTTVQKHNI